MEIERVDELLEAVFDEQPPEEEGIGPAPNRMKQFFPPEGQSAPASGAAPSDDLEALWSAVENDYRNHAIAKAEQGGVQPELQSKVWDNIRERVKSEFMHDPKAQASARARHGDMSDRAGHYSMGQMMPKDQVASNDDLVDFYSRASRDPNPSRKAALMKEFGAHKSEFESRLHSFVNALLG